MSKRNNLHLNQCSDEELMKMYKQGEYYAFETLYDRHSAKVFDYLKKRVTKDVAQDILQDVFLKVHRGRNRYSEAYPFLPWLFTISRNSLYDYFKSLKSTSELPSQVQSTEPQESEVPELNLVLALEGLPENQRRAIELRYLEDWSFEQIAKDIKTSPENVRQLISRGLKKARELFGESNEE